MEVVIGVEIIIIIKKYIMENCFIFRLKGEVNDEFPILNAIEFEAKTNNDGVLTIPSLNDNTHLMVYLLSNGMKFDAYPNGKNTKISDTQIECWGYDGYYGFYVKDVNNQILTNTLVKIRVIKKTDIRSLNSVYRMDLGDLEYLTNLIEIRESSGGYVSGDIVALSRLVNLQRIVLFSVNNTITGDIANLSALTHLTYISMGNNRIYGDIAVFKNLQNVTYFSFDGVSDLSGSIENMPSFADNATVSLGNGQSINGTIEAYVQRIRSVRTTGSGIKMYQVSNTSATFNGSSLVNGAELSWTASTITYNGVTINA